MPDAVVNYRGRGGVLKSHDQARWLNPQEEILQVNYQVILLSMKLGMAKKCSNKFINVHSTKWQCL
jgi:hypothetical protein